MKLHMMKTACSHRFLAFAVFGVAKVLAAALAVPSLPAPEYDDCEVVTNCVFDASRRDARIFTLRMEIDAVPSNGVEVVFGRDADNDGILSRTEEALVVGYDCGEWKVVDCATGDETTCTGPSGRVVFDWKLRLGSDRVPRSLAATVNGQQVLAQFGTSPASFLFDPAWNAAKVVRRGPVDPHPNILCSVDNDPLFLYFR